MAEFLQEKFLAVIATTRQDGTPLLSPVWYEYADGVFRVVVNQGDAKDRHLGRNPWLTLVVAEQAFPYRGVEVAGRAELNDRGAFEATTRLAQRYLTPQAARSYLAKVSAVPGRLVELRPDRVRAWDFLDFRGSMNEPLDLHHATLLTVCTDWQTGTATIQVRSIRDQGFEVMAFGVRAVSIPRENPWGPSKYINDIRGPDELGSQLQRLDIEMQSGDVITILAQSFRLPPTVAQPKPSHQ